MQVSFVSDRLLSFKKATAGELFGLKMVKFSSDMGGLGKASHRKIITSGLLCIHTWRQVTWEGWGKPATGRLSRQESPYLRTIK